MKPFRTKVLKKYYTYQQLTQAFAEGAVFRASQSSLDGDMTWTYGQKPHLVAATALGRAGASLRMPEALLTAADTALYKAKQNGRNRVEASLLIAAG